MMLLPRVRAGMKRLILWLGRWSRARTRFKKYHVAPHEGDRSVERRLRRKLPVPLGSPDERPSDYSSH